jgi:uncharacterized protein
VRWLLFGYWSRGSGARQLLQLLAWCIATTLFTARGFATEVPPLEGRVNDHARILSAAAQRSLTSKLEAFERATGHQLAILTIPSLAGDPIEDYSIRVVESWKLGKKGADDGVLLVVASGDRKMRIEVGYGLEGSLPDAAAGRIVREVMAPYFRRGDYDGGITAAVNAILSSTGGESLVGSEPQSDPSKKNLPQSARGTAAPVTLGWIVAGLFKLAFFAIFVVVIIVLFVFNLLGGGRSRGIYIGSSSGGSNDGGGFGSDSFSGGGGSFGGGGASGDW